MFLLKIQKYPVLRIIKIGRDLHDHLIQPSILNYHSHPKPCLQIPHLDDSLTLPLSGMVNPPHPGTTYFNC